MVKLVPLLGYQKRDYTVAQAISVGFIGDYECMTDAIILDKAKYCLVYR